jgi:hypothetical protein
MRRAFLLCGLAVWLFSCSDRGNEQGQENMTSPMQSDPRDTVNIGVGAGVNSNAGEMQQDAPGTGTGAAAGMDTGGRTGTGDTSTRGRRQ